MTAAARAAPNQAQPAVGEDAMGTNLSNEEYLGMVKSYNERRGFGFVACERTASAFGRDVYIAKAEARMATEELLGGQPGKPLPSMLGEEDLIRFRVRFSADRMPQAERIRRVRKFAGVVVEAPKMEADAVGRIVCEELRAACGCRDVLLRRAQCGQTRLSAGDWVSFCVDMAGTSGGSPEALLVLLTPHGTQIAERVLGCFAMTLPRGPPSEGPPTSAGVKLDCHALADRLILAGLPSNLEDGELMRFFSKHGATGVAVAQSRTGVFASVGFASTNEIVKFVGRSVHTFADDRDTRLVQLSEKAHGPCSSTLPGLPAPVLSPADDAGVLLVRWSPILLAKGYIVELRPHCSQAEWSVIEAPGGLFGKGCSSCRVSGLPSTVPFEARVTYVASCGCKSDASDASMWCLPFAAVPGAQCFWPSAPMTTAPGQPPYLHNQHSGHDGWSAPPSWQAAPTLSTQPGPSQLHPNARLCAHGYGNPEPAAPELRVVHDGETALVVQWLSVPSATGYVIELREPQAAHTERFTRSVPAQAAGTALELRVGGLRATAAGSRYAAQIRSVLACGCESAPSTTSYVQVPSARPPAVDKAKLVALNLADACPLPAGRTSADAAPMQELPSLLVGKMSPHHSPTGANSCGDFGAVKQAPISVADLDDEDCIVLD